MIVAILWRHPPDKSRLRFIVLGLARRSIANASRAPVEHSIRKCYAILEVDPSCDDETIIRKAYLQKVKQYHPDAPFEDSTGDKEKFNEVQQAYEVLTNALKSNGPDNDSSAGAARTDDPRMKFDIRHTAPQHRTHLEYGGYGMGTPSQRQAAYYKMRAEKAYESVYEYRRDRESSETSEEFSERKKRRDVKSTNFVERLVEDLIQESMSRGDFNNIRSSGKPIHERNPHYMDFTTYKINEILIDNGYMPEWILLEKQVREAVDEARIHLKRLFKAIASEGAQSLDERKADLGANTQWEGALTKFRADIAEVNLDINKLNLVVPMLWRQQVHYNAEREIEKILALDPSTIELPPSAEELALIEQEAREQRHQEWSHHQTLQRYSLGDALRDFFQAFRNFKV